MKLARQCESDPPDGFFNMDRDWPLEDKDLGTVVKYQCPYLKKSSKYGVASKKMNTVFKCTESVRLSQRCK